MADNLRSTDGASSGPILVIDDDDRFRSFVATSLSTAGFAVREAATGNEALALAQTEPPALVLLDVCLLESSGFEVCRQLRDDFGDNLPVIFVSGTRSEPFDRAAGLQIGGDDYLVKPVDPIELIARVRTHLARSRRQDPLAFAAKFGLTKREIAILRRLAQGLRQTEIAVELSISPRTVANHLQHTLTKLGLHSRIEAVAFAYEIRLVEPANTRTHTGRRDLGQS
jgi:two-component system nitrate/nitrite response regulator NarL